jgi:hypothetical protein
MHHRGGLGLWLWCLAPLSCFITGFVTRVTWQVPLVEQELLTLPENLSSPPDFCRVRVTRTLVLCVCFVDHCLLFCTFSFAHCVVCSFSIYGFWLPIFFRYMDSDYPYFVDIWILITRIFSIYGFWLPVFFRWILITRIFSMDSDYPYFFDGFWLPLWYIFNLFNNISVISWR